MIAVVAVVAVFLLCQIPLISSNSLSTQIAVKSTAYDSVKTQAVFLRDEHLLDNSDGIVVQNVVNGGKVAKNGEVAKVFGDRATAENYTKMLQLQEKIDYFNDLKSMTLGEAAGIETMNVAIHESVNSIVRNKNTNSPVSIDGFEEELNDLLIRRQILVGKSIDFDATIAELNSQIDALNSSGVSAKSTFVSESAGNFSSLIDGFESYYGFNEVANMSVDQVTTAIEETAKPQEVKAIGKMITGFQWHIVCVMDSEVVASLSPGTTVTVALSSDASVVIDAKVVAKNVESVKAEKVALILSCDEMNEKLSGLRNEKVEIRLSKYEGLRVDNAAIVIKDEKKGIYALVGNKIVFREIEVIYSGDGFVICKINNDDAKNIKIYDNIIVGGRDLYDGKFIN